MRRTATGRAARRAAAGPPRAVIAPLRISRAGVRRIGLVCVWATVFCGAAYGLYRLEPVSRALLNGGGPVLRWVELPPWLNEPQAADVLGEIEAAAGLRARDDVHAPDLCERVATGLAASPWVERVQRVTKQADGVVRVLATFRRPVAMVLHDGVAHVVDHAGVRLPRQAPAADAARYNFLLISGVRKPLPPIGASWNSDDLAAGLALVQFIESAAAQGRAPVRAVLRGVDVGNVNRRRNARDGELRLIPIYPGSYIDWGLAPGREYDIECTAEGKLASLNGILAQYGQWPSEQWFDVRPHDRVLRGKVNAGTP